MDTARYLLQTERLTLRPLTNEHLGQLEDILAHVDVVKTLLGDASTPEAVRGLAQIWISEPEFWESRGFGYWGVFDDVGQFGNHGALLGVVGAGDPPPDIGEGPEIYYLFARYVWGNGVAGEAVPRMCDYLFEDVGVPALEALVFAELNPGSVRTAEKVGMQLVGRLPLVGHHLSEERARETMQFDIWRVGQASQSRGKEVLAEAAFRIGQLLAEGAWSKDEAVGRLRATAKRSEGCAEMSTQELERIIDASIAKGSEAKGVSHFRVRRNEYAYGR